MTTELGRVTEDLELLAALVGRLSDAQTLYELIEEEDDESLRPEVEEMLADLDRRSVPSSSGRCSPASTTTATRWPRSTPGPAAPTPRTGPR